MVLRLADSWSNWNLEMLVFEERGKPEYPGANLSEQGREPTTNLSYESGINIVHECRQLLAVLFYPVSGVPTKLSERLEQASFMIISIILSSGRIFLLF